MSDELRVCAIIPVYRHGKTLREVVEKIMSKGIPAVIVDDGNEAETKSDIAAVKAAIPAVEVITLPKNQGKGGAVMEGMRRARELGFTHGFQIDADGQHDLDVIGEFLTIAEHNPDALVCGYPVYDESVPAARKNGRKITNGWVAIETLSRDVEDAMCGFRLYPLESGCKVIRRSYIGKRMTFDIDILVRLHWAGVPMIFRPIKVIYPEDGISNFRMVRDNVAISLMHTKLFFGMLLRSPIILARKAVRHGAR